jgi:hypothetical protein
VSGNVVGGVAAEYRRMWSGKIEKIPGGELASQIIQTIPTGE